MEESSIKIVILAFNAGTSGLIVNGPGISLRNLIVFMNQYHPKVSFKLCTRYRSDISSSNLTLLSIKDKQSVRNAIKESDIVHIWSGLRDRFASLGEFANNIGRPVIAGPNLFDTVNLESERSFFKKIKFQKILASNPNVANKIAEKHNLNYEMVSHLMVGPDRNMWYPPKGYSEYILWKGNSRQHGKGFQMAKKVAAALPHYKFLFMGAGSPYEYEKHISVASKAALFLNTSISETKGMAQLEQMSAGVPSIVSNGVYAKGIDGKTGFFAKNSVKSYASLIEEALSDSCRLTSMRGASVEYVDRNFSAKRVCEEYLEVIKSVG